MKSLDLNSDLGEHDSPEGRARDADLMPLLSSVSIACGGHAGSREVMQRTAHVAAKHGVAIGAHPGLPDRADFGRTERVVPSGTIIALVTEQVSLLKELLRDNGLALRHVKPHGALYNMAAANVDVAQAIVAALRAIDSSLLLYALAGSVLARTAQAAGVRVVREAFADRAYHADGRLVSRSTPGAVLTDPALVRRRVHELLRGSVASVEGPEILVKADSLCIHADSADALTLATLIRRELASAGIQIAAPSHAI